MGLEQWTAFAQIASVLAMVTLAIAVFFRIEAAQQQAEATRKTVEVEQSRLEQERPQVIRTQITDTLLGSTLLYGTSAKELLRTLPLSSPHLWRVLRRRR